MTIYIPTYGRTAKQKTITWLCDRHRHNSFLVCRPEEEEELRNRYGHGYVGGFLVEEEKGVAAARQTAIDNCETDICLMFDDDLQFCQRVKGWDFVSNNRALKPTQKEVNEAVDWLYKNTNKDYPMTCIGPRGGNNRIKARWELENDRIMRSFAVHVPTLRKHNIRFDDFYYWEDFHVALSLLELGYKNKINVDAVTGGTTNAVGGVVRNNKKMWAQIKKFKRVHPTIRIREKEMNCPTTKKRVSFPDMTVYWKKAFRSKV